MAMISGNLNHIRSVIASVCNRLGKDPESVDIVGVTKYADIQAVRQALDAGLFLLGENKVQQAQRKFAVLRAEGRPFKAHMIGHLQTNKVKSALSIFDVIQSVDSQRLAEKIDLVAGQMGRQAEIFIQVNTSGEPQKYGVSEHELQPLLRVVAGLPHVLLTGLMTIAPWTDDRNLIRECFKRLRTLYDKIRTDFTDAPNVRLSHLSMGMTADFDIAIEEGANMVRIGRAIFYSDDEQTEKT